MKENNEKNIQDAQEALTKGNQGIAAELMHKTAGSLLNFGLKGAGAEAKFIENSIQTDNLEEIQRRLESLGEKLGKAVSQLAEKLEAGEHCQVEDPESMVVR
uniref:HPt domain-containing protein n=1 Tax=Magnetococcus massalia (strain MO-1) TaxID=451514 RepID=A0A1S7LJG1_MAGMO|nr:protein of unknown function [include Hpt domain] [Candidatus Magnetococcus massalia]